MPRQLYWPETRKPLTLAEFQHLLAEAIRLPLRAALDHSLRTRQCERP
jgi:hypothetical protein